MVDIPSLLSSGFNLAETIKSIVRMKNEVEKNKAIRELDQTYMALREEYGRLQEENEVLREDNKKFKAWDTENNRYKLRDFGGKTFAYELDPEKANGEEPHLLCPTCFQKKRKSIIQFTRKLGNGQDSYRCSPCNEYIYLGEAKYEPNPPGRHYGEFDPYP